MKLFSDLLENHAHSLFASFVGVGSSLMFPLGDMLDKIIIGIVVGVSTWIITRIMSWLIDKVKKAIQCGK